jgi:hypothetical protein
MGFINAMGFNAQPERMDVGSTKIFQQELREFHGNMEVTDALMKAANRKTPSTRFFQ